MGAIASSIASAWAWFNSIGLVPVFTFITGAFFTMYTQERLEKKRRKRNFQIKMTEHIYGPLHRELNSILVNLKDFQWPTVTSFDNIMEDYRFDLVKREIHTRIEEFKKRLPRYVALLSDARRETESYIMKGLSKHEKEWEVTFGIWIAGKQSHIISLIEPIFKDRGPLDFLIERTGSYENASIIVYVRGKSEGVFSKEHRIHKISMEILEEVRKDPLVIKQRRERENLLNECNSLIESLGKEIVL